MLSTISAGHDHSVSIKSDGSVIATGAGMYGQLSVNDWKDMVDALASALCSIGMTKDGKVVAVGKDIGGRLDVSSWEDIIAIYAGEHCTLGLTADEKVLAT